MRAWLQHGWHRMVSVLHLDDPPQRIARGVAIGVFIALQPIIGFQMLVSAALAALAGGNKVAAASMAWLTNPLTLVPVFGANYWIGTLLLGSHPDPNAQEGIARAAAASNEISLLRPIDWLNHTNEAVRQLGTEVLGPLVLGSLVVGLLGGIVVYPLTLWAIRARRR